MYMLGRRMQRLSVAASAAVLLLALGLGVDAAGYNETEWAGEFEPNQLTFRALLDSGASRTDAVQKCVRAVKNMRQKFAEPKRYTFPSRDFVPEGTQEWCECLVANPPKIGEYSHIRDYDDEYMYGDLMHYRSLVPAGLRDAYDDSFDHCRAQVLEGSNINTIDICRGMFLLFGEELNTLQVSFCGRLCSYPDSIPYHHYLSSPEFTFNHSCADDCAREAMPGYCSNTLLEYSNFKGIFGVGPGGTSVARSVNVSGEKILFERVFNGPPPGRDQVDRVCSAMAPSLGGKNECCNYEKGFSLLKQCCVLDDDGMAIFDCNMITKGDLFHMCTVENNPWPEFFNSYYEKFCGLLLEEYNSNPNYAGTGKVFGSTIRFPDEMLIGICESYGYDAGTLCCGPTGIPFVENCVADSVKQGYTGQIMGNRPTKPTSGASSVPVDPCHGLCGGDRNCVLSENDVPFCVECSALLVETADGSDGECCEYDAEKLKCSTIRKGLEPGTCRREHDIFVINEEGDRESAVFKKSTGFACSNPRDFRKNGKACRVEINAAGEPRCYE